MNKNLLREWFDEAGKGLREAGFALAFSEHRRTSCGVQVDGPRVVGAICHWPPDLFEFHFIDAGSGRDIVIDTVHLQDASAVERHLEWLRKTHSIG